MANNSLAPGFVRLKYTANAHQHVMTFGINLVNADNPEEVLVINKFGQETDLNSWLLGDFADALKVFYGTTDSLDEAEVWAKPTPESDPVFKALIPMAIVGTAASPAATIAIQGVLTLRAAAGGIGKVYLMEPRALVNIHDPRPFTDNRVSGLGAILTTSASCWYARDNSYPVLALTWNTKTNDALRKKFILNV